MKLSTLYTAFAGLVALHVVSAVTETQELRKTKSQNEDTQQHADNNNTSSNHHNNNNSNTSREPPSEQKLRRMQAIPTTIFSLLHYHPQQIILPTANQQHLPQNLQGVQQPSVTWTRIVATLQQEKYNCTDNSRIVHKRRCLHQGLAFARTMVG